MTNPNFSHEVWKGVAGQGERGRLGIWAWFRSRWLARRRR